MLSRKDKLLKYVSKSCPGIEIGPSYNPMAPKSEGYNVKIIDHLNKTGLINKYSPSGIDVSKIEDVDFIWNNQSYAELTGKKNYFEWIIASHLIEHTPDLIGFLNDCTEVLSEKGIISLAIPDKRYCFDHYRPITGISKIIDNHLAKSKVHTPGTVAEYFLNVVSMSNQITWTKESKGAMSFIHNKEDAISGMKTVIKDSAYLDVHAWCFVPHSFRLLIHDLNLLGLIKLREVDFFQTEGCEFFMTLGKHGKGMNLNRNEVQEVIKREISE